MVDDVVPVKCMVVEDDDDVARAIARRLGQDGVEVEVSAEAKPVLARLDAGLADWDVVILDVGLPDANGVDVLRRFREAGALSSVVMLTGDRTANTAATCMRAGAFYYLTKPFEAFELSAMVRSAARHSQLRRELAGAKRALAAPELLVGTSAAMRKLRAAADRLAAQDVPILIQGESGTGKELVARTLHDRGPRRGKPFVALNCGAIPESLIDSELFGHAKGAFTGATTDRAGVFVEADRGTLFLDEIGDMPLAVQARLLRVLQEGEVRPVGGSGTRTVDVRVIAASHVDLDEAVAEQRFRQDLFYRLNVVTLRVPSLRERQGDLPLLAAHFLHKHGGAKPPSLSPESLDALTAYDWPGNVRELENAVLHAIALGQGEAIGPEALPASIARRAGARAAASSGGGAGDDVDLDQPLTEAKRRATLGFERRYLVRVMERAKGSVSEGARLAGLDRTNFRRLLQRHALDPATFKP
ncbi:MAG TPA: sigma-54 dependent transcriptional regulator [Kofleriaceae bacterium]|jgi:DNA-binding NtrC family response regulator